MVERRQHPRVPKECRLTFQLLGDAGTEGPVHEGATMNLGDGGLRFQTDQPLRNDQNLWVEIYPVPDQDPIPARVRVIWVQSNDQNTTVGAEFVWIASSPLAPSPMMAPENMWSIL